MMLAAGHFRIRNALPKPVWTYPFAYISFHTYSIEVTHNKTSKQSLLLPRKTHEHSMLQGLLENEYLGEVFAVGEVRSISGYQAIQGNYQISPDTNSKWRNMLVLLAMAFGYRLLVYVLLRFGLNKNVSGCLLLSHKKNNSSR